MSPYPDMAKYRVRQRVILTQGFKIGDLVLGRGTKGVIYRISGGMLSKKYEILWDNLIKVTMNGDSQFIRDN